MNKRNIPIYVSAIILALCTIYFLFKGNFEFLVYAFTLFPLMWVIAKTDKMFNYPALAKWGFMVWMITHMAGGSLFFNGVRLYDTILFSWIGEPYNILRYDQLIHAFCYFVMALFVYAIVATMSKPKTSRVTMIVMTFLGAMGISALNEVVEFIAVAFFHSTGVGNYYNNALDLVFNGAGIVAALFFMRKRKV